MATSMQPVAAMGAPGSEKMAKPEGVGNCPPGLEYLTQLDQLLVHQQVELMEVVTGIDFQNKYVIKNTMGQQVYFAGEQSEFCMRCFCKSNRTFSMTVTDNMGQEIMKMHRPWKCCTSAAACWCAGTCDCYTDEITVECPPGEVLGKIKHGGSKWYPHLEVKDLADNTMFDIWGPCCLCQCVCYHPDLDFTIYSQSGQSEIGNITKQWAGAVKEIFTKVSNYGIQFPIDLDVRMKAMLLGATILIEYLYIESQKDGGGGGGGGS